MGGGVVGTERSIAQCLCVSVHIWRVRMFVAQWLVAMPVGLGFDPCIVRPMRMVMVLVVHMEMRVLYALMSVLVLMILGQVQPDADTH